MIVSGEPALCLFFQGILGGSSQDGRQWLISMAIVSPLTGVTPLPNSWTSWLVNGGDPNYLQVLGWSSKYNWWFRNTLRLKSCKAWAIKVSAWLQHLKAVAARAVAARAVGHEISVGNLWCDYDELETAKDLCPQYPTIGGSNFMVEKKEKLNIRKLNRKSSWM